ncbi:hypothetical protein [Lyngbya aestuarii]|uniref:hypothetical protein n=1 Tax=Lyngbya aestuarii TaxID=118322 RepID=UPI00403DA4DC
MNRDSQLARLILNFYREEPQQLQQLELLRTCKVFRRWGVLYIRCHNRETAAALAGACQTIAEPIARLRLAKKITILTKNNLLTTFAIDFSKISA